MSRMETMRTEQNTLGMVEAPSDKLSGDPNSRMEMSSTLLRTFMRSAPVRTGTALI